MERLNITEEIETIIDWSDEKLEEAERMLKLEIEHSEKEDQVELARRLLGYVAFEMFSRDKKRND